MEQRLPVRRPVVAGLFYPDSPDRLRDELARAILGGSRVLAEDELAHAREHAVEVQLPFLLRLQPEIAVVPITLMGSDLGFCMAVGHAVAAAVASAGEPV